ncbi:outer membrane beta-barrel protein [Candidatus Poribacteria bacterium]|nr:outer membrane beta-barrel protein [Candidatus Poribacteria bacterium]
MIYALILIVALSLAQTVEAQKSQERKLGLSLEVGQVQVSEDNLDNGQFISASFTYVVPPTYSLKVSVGQTELELEELGKLTLRPVTVTVQYHFPTSNNKLLPYIGGGAGYYQPKIDLTEAKELLETDLEALEDEIPGVRILSTTVKGELENKIAFHIVGGLEYNLSTNFLIYGNARYTFLQTEGDFTIKARVKYLSEPIDVDSSFDTDIDLNPLWLSVGLKFIF